MPPRLTNSSCVPVSQMAPRSMTTMRSRDGRWRADGRSPQRYRPAIRLAKGALHEHFGFRVQFGRRLVQNQNGWILQQSPAMAMRWRCPPERRWPRLANHGLIALRHFLNESSARPHAPPRALASPLASAAITDVVVDGVIKKDRLLVTMPIWGAQGIELNVANVAAVDGDAP